MHLLVYGPGRLGAAIAARPPRPAGRRRSSSAVPSPAADDPPPALTSSWTPRAASAVVANLEHALAAGNRAFVLATTGWDADRRRPRPPPRAGAAAVVAPNLSLGAALFLRLAETRRRLVRRAGAFEPSIVEWHRAGKADRPSGTARAIARRIVAADPRWATGRRRRRAAGRSRWSASAPGPRPGRTS